MNRIYFGLIFLFLLPAFTFAQNAYWQQEVNYQINVSLDDQEHTLTATEEVEYINHSPDQLTFIYFHLWPNAYQNNRTALARQLRRQKELDFEFAGSEQRGYIFNLDFKVNGQSANVELYEQNPDIVKILLDAPLLPGQRLVITTPFRVKLPGSFSRLGHVGQSYQITQWFPKPAVYDQRGWHPMPYLDQGEFYSEFGKFDVRITLPANYTVGATGVLQNNAEKVRLDSLAAQTASKTQFTNDVSFPASATETKTLHYVQDNIHDFAWFADKRFQVLKSQIVLPESGRTVTTWLMFLNKNAAAWVKSVKAINEAVTYYSKWVGEYPYEQVMAVDGALSAGSGMEYPMVTVTDPEAIVHEVGHNWFYGILASNEREYAWMDEGINSYYEFRIGELENPNYSQLEPLVNSPKLRRLFGLENIHANSLNILLYQMAASRGLAQPVQLPSPAFSGSNYGSVVYMKTAILFKYLAAYLGQATFDEAMRTYYQKWQFRHPYPQDLQAIIEQVSGQQLDWFFQDLITKNIPVEAAITATEPRNGAILVNVKNRSGFAAPIPVAAVNQAGKILELKWTKPGSGSEQLTFTQASGATKIVIDPQNILPELNRRNNEYRLTGSFRGWEPVKPQFLGGIEQSDRQQLYYLPVIGANTYDKFMLGVAVTNSTLIQKKIQYLAVPMYSFHEKRLNGFGSVNVNLLSHSFSQNAVLGVKAARFERFTKYEPAFTFNFKRATGYAAEQQARLAFTHVSQMERFPLGGENTYFDYKFAYTIPSLQYGRMHRDGRQHFALQASTDLFIVNRSILSSTKPVLGKLTLEYDRYYRKNKQIYLRWFTGKFFGDPPAASPFSLGLSGSLDYKKETVFPDRSQRSKVLTAFVHQTDNREGAFKNYLPVYANRWLSTVNLAADLPAIPIILYTDLGLASFYQAPAISGLPTELVRAKFYYGSGLSVTRGKLLQLYFPVAGSNFEHHFPASFREFTRNIRFVFNLSAFDPFKQLTEALK